MAIQRLNHAVLYVSDLARSVAFYTEVLGFRTTRHRGRAVFLQAAGSTNDHDLGLFELAGGASPGASRSEGPLGPSAGTRTVGLYHLAWEVDTLAELQRMATALSAVGALAGATDHTTTKSLYAQDPDGIEFEVCWVLPADRLDAVDPEAAARLLPLDLDREIARYGGDTVGGLGVSVPART